MIDLRSDTVTKPDSDMRKIMAEAVVGDDVYGEDSSINELQDYVADLFGKEAALYVPSGTMSNQICIKLHTNPGEEIICDADAHIYYYETGAPAMISQVMIKGIPSNDGMPSLNEIKEAIRPDIYYFPKTSLVCLENTHNRHGGAIIDNDYINKLAKICKENNLKFHLDGARIWNAHIASGISLKEYTKHFDSISVCLSKGLGAPVGSVLLGTKEFVQKAWKVRKILGGGMRQAGIIASAGLYALKNNLEKLAYDHHNAKTFAKDLNEMDEIYVDLNSVQTNMVRFRLDDSLNSKEFVTLCQKNGLLIGALEKNWIRAVFHLQVTANDTSKALEIIKFTIKQMKAD